MSDHVENQEQPQELFDLKVLITDMLRGLKKFWWIIVLLTVTLAVFGAWRTVRSYRPMYRCEASFTVNTQSSSNANYTNSFIYDQATAMQMEKTFPHILRSDLLSNLMKEDLQVSYIPGTISASAVADSNLFTLTVVSSTPEDAKRVMDSVIKNYPRVSAYVVGETVLNIINPPVLPTEPYNSLSWMNAALKYAILGMALGCVLLAAYAFTRSTVRTEQQIGERLGKKCLGVIPQVVFKQRSGKVDMSVSVRNDRAGYSFRESIQGCALHTSNLMAEKGYKVLGVAGSVAGEGVSTVAWNIALALSDNGQKVLFFNGGFTQPGRRDSTNVFGLEDYLRGGCGLEDILVYDERNRIWTVATSRRMSYQETVSGGNALQGFIDQMRPLVDYVVVDIPPCDKLNQAVPAVELCDGLVYVIRQDNTKIGTVMDRIEDLSQYDAELLGCVLNGARTGLAGYSYGYGYGYGYGGYTRYGSYGRYGYGYGYGEKKK